MKKRQEAEASGGQRRLPPEEYRNTFMRPYRIEDRKPVLISRKLRDTLERFACKIGGNRMSFLGLLENTVRHHIRFYTGDFEFCKKLQVLIFIQFKKHFGEISFSGALKMETFIFGGSKFMFWSDQNRLLPLPEVPKGHIPLVYKVSKVGTVNKKRNRMIQKNDTDKNKGGRPAKGLSEKRKYRITVKMATGEYYALKSKARKAGVSASEMVRQAVDGCVVRERLTTEQADFIRKLCGMANNLNQLTRRAHREGVRLHSGQCRHLLLSLETLIDRISL